MLLFRIMWFAQTPKGRKAGVGKCGDQHAGWMLESPWAGGRAPLGGVSRIDLALDPSPHQSLTGSRATAAEARRVASYPVPPLGPIDRSTNRIGLKYIDGGGRGRGVNGAPASKVGETPAQTGSLKRSNCFCLLDATALELLNVRKAPLDFCDCSREETLIPMRVQCLKSCPGAPPNSLPRSGGVLVRPQPRPRPPSGPFPASGGGVAWLLGAGRPDS